MCELDPSVKSVPIKHEDLGILTDIITFSIPIVSS